MADDDYAAAGGTNLSHTPGKHRGPRFSWTSQYEATFFRSLCESVQLNLREGSTFKQEAWDRAIQALATEHNAYANKGHLINKSDNARKKFRLWRGLREDPEFVYDPTTRMVTASEDAWKRHIEVRQASSNHRSRHQANAAAASPRKSHFPDPSRGARLNTRNTTRFSSPMLLGLAALPSV